MPKTTNLNLELTTDASTHFEDWRKFVNGQGTHATDYSNTQLIDQFAGKFAGGNSSQYYRKSTSADYDMGWETPDAAPTANSEKLLTSGGVKAALDTLHSNVQEEISATDTGASETVVLTDVVLYELLPNVFYNFTGSLTSLTLIFGAAVSGRENEYKGQFVCGDTPPAIVFPSSIQWVKSFPTLEANKTYQFSVVNNIGVIVGV